MAILRADNYFLRGDVLDPARLRGDDAVGKTRSRRPRGECDFGLCELSGATVLAIEPRGDLSVSEKLRHDKNLFGSGVARHRFRRLRHAIRPAPLADGRLALVSRHGVRSEE